jgi:cytochrome P450
MEIAQTLLLAAALLLPFSWLLRHLLSAPAQRKSDGRRRIPSPPGLPVIGHLHLLKKPLHRSLADLARRHGGGTGLLLLRFGARPVLLVSSPAVADECFTAHDMALADRPGLASRRLLTGDDCPAIATASYGPLWRRLRRLATVHALCAHRLAATAAARDAEVRALAARIRSKGPGAVVQVKAAAYEFVANVIMAMVAGESLPEEKVRTRS